MKANGFVTAVGAAVLCSILAVPATAGNKKLMTVNAAKVLAERAIVESVIGLRQRATERVEDMIAADYKIEANTAAAIKGIQYDDIVYDPEKDIAKVTASINVGRVINIIGMDIDYGDRTIRRTAFATSTPEMAGPLKALRAAELDAYKQLLKNIVGFKLESGTTVQNFILQNDMVRTKLLATIWGAEMVGYRWDKDGDAYVKMQLKASYIRDILRQRIVDNFPDPVVVEGTGAQVDDYQKAFLEQENAAATFNTQIREASLGIPVAPVVPLEGAAIQPRPVDEGGAASRQRVVTP
jgi:hypothetical protein